MKKKYYIVLVVIGIFFLIIFMQYRNKENIRFVQNMGVGINFGNSLDSTRVKAYKPDANVRYYEEAWNNPSISKELFTMVKDAGFGTVRIPVSWDEHIDEEGTIDPLWMARVEEVVLQGLEEDLYIILDLHHESWLIPTIEEEKQTTKMLIKIWSQIAERFQNIGEKLLFEGMNEPRLEDSDDEWNGGTPQMRGVVNRLNQAFVDTVRNSGSENENESRYLIVTPYGTDYHDVAVNDLVVPKDDRIIVAIHSYSPYGFSLDEEGTDEWNASDSEDTKDILAWINNCYHKFIKKGIPVILTEFACIDKDNLKDRMSWTEFYVKELQAHHINYIWWDSGNGAPLMDRDNYEWLYPELVEILLKE